MLEKLYRDGFLDYSKLFIKYAKSLGLNAEEAFILIKILDNYLKFNTLSLESLQEEVLITSNKMDKTLANLMERGYYDIFLSYENGKGTECISFANLFSKIESLIERKEEVDAYDIKKTNDYLVSKMNRVLTASELEILQGLMIDDHYSFEEIMVCTENIISSKKVLSVRNLVSKLASTPKEIKPNVEAPKAFKDFLSRI